MPKMKTNKAAAKRFNVRKGGTIARGHQGTTHLLSGRSRKVKRGLRQNTVVAKNQAKMIKTMIQG